MTAAATNSEVELWLVRHAHAGDSMLWQGPDEVRPLTERGRRQAERLGAFLAGADVRPDAIITSPKARAAETAEIIAAALAMKVRFDDRLADGLGLGGLAALLGELKVRRPMLVGHDPDFTDLVGVLCEASGVEMKKGALARIDLTMPPLPGCGTLRWLVPPDLLRGG
jgi:phosphohistidine phosphatase